jgi:hypothetical protein
MDNMTWGELKKEFAKIGVQDDWFVVLSSDEEGNHFGFISYIEHESRDKAVFLFPTHREYVD